MSNPVAHGTRLLWEQFPTKANYSIYLHSQLVSFGERLSHTELLNIQAVFCGF